MNQFTVDAIDSMAEYQVMTRLHPPHSRESPVNEQAT